MTGASPRIVLISDAPGELRERLGALGEVLQLPPQAAGLAERSAELHRADCVVLHAPPSVALGITRRVHDADTALQVIILTPGEERRQVERALLFTPGLGEIWVLAPESLDAGVVERARVVTQQRRRFRATRRRIAEDLATVEPQRGQRALISDAYLAALLQVLPDAVVSIDEADHVLSWSPAAEALIGYAGADAVGRRLAEVLNPQDPDELEQVLDGGTHQLHREELRLRTRQGEPVVAEVTVVPVDAAGQRVRSVVLHDVTEQRRAQEELEQQAMELEAQAAHMEEQAAEMEALNAELQVRTLELEAALATRSRFYAAMSHELRTPMNAIIGYNALLLDELFGPLAPPQADAVRRSQRAAHHLLELVNDVLDLAKIEAGRIEVQGEETCFPDLLLDLLVTVRPMAEQNGTLLELERGSGTHCLHTDPRRVRQILLNLLSNAIKFGERKPVRVSWAALPGGGVSIAVVDRGRGIAPEDQARIFEEFVQIGNPEGKGTGLGLPISRRLAQALGGSLTVRSAPGEGSEFRLELPGRMGSSSSGVEG